MNIIKTIDEIKANNELTRFEKGLRIRDIFQNLSLEEGKAIAQYAIGLISSKNWRESSNADMIITNLACLSSGMLENIYKALLDRGMYQDGFLYREAGNEIRDRLYAIETKDVGVKKRIFQALAWIGDEFIQKDFLAREGNPILDIKRKRKYKFVADQFTLDAGWYFDKESKRKNLYYEYAHEFRKPKTQQDIEESPVKVFVEKEEVCPWCERNLFALLEIDLTYPEFEYLGFPGERLTIMTCDFCVCYTEIFNEIDWDGTVSWSGINEIRYEEPWKIASDNFKDFTIPPYDQLVLGPKTDNPLRGAYYDLPNICSQIGGHPGWVQYADYPKCPKCNAYMKFLAQIHYDDISEGRGEGVVYAFICKDCKMVCTIYQQG